MLPVKPCWRLPDNGWNCAPWAFRNSRSSPTLRAGGAGFYRPSTTWFVSPMTSIFNLRSRQFVCQFAEQISHGRIRLALGRLVDRDRRRGFLQRRHRPT